MKVQRVLRTAWLGSLLLVAVAACDSVFNTGPDRAENARVTVTGTSAGPLQLILSNEFVGVPDPTTGQLVTVLGAADTFNLTLPINRSHPLGAGERIFVRLTNPDSMSTAEVLMRIHLDDREVYNQRANLRNSFLEYQFTYQ